MILVYPMLTSESVNPAILPGLIKTIEKYIIIHHTDEVLKYMNSVLGDVVKSTISTAAGAAASIAVAALVIKMKGKIPTLRVKGKNIVMTEQIVDPHGNPISSGKSKGGGKPKSAVDPKTAGDEMKNAVKNAGVSKFEMPRHDSVSLEPTWVQVHTNMGAKLLGVKVVPFKVTSTTGMVGLLMSDKELKKMDLLATKMGRTAMRVLGRIARTFKLPGFTKPVTGNIKNDVVWAKSQYGKNTFVCFSQLDLEKEDIFTSPEAVQRLHKLGWASMVIADDVNKQATFCMKQFGGVCSTIPYSHIFASLGKEHQTVYKDLEDAQRSAGPFFRKKSTTRRKLFSDSKSMSKLAKYSTLKE